jgi:hypothetical protein
MRGIVWVLHPATFHAFEQVAAERDDLTCCGPFDVGSKLMQRRSMGK